MPRLVPLAIAAWLLAATTAAADAPAIVVAAATPGASLVAPDGSVRPLNPGDHLAAADRIRTAEGAVANLLFADHSALTLGQQGDLALEQFAYDPASGQGRLVLRLDRGALRYVGGRLSKSGSVAVRMGPHVAALTGGIGLFSQPPSGDASVAMLYGKMLTVTGPNQTSQTIYRENFGMALPQGSGLLPAPSPLLMADLAQFNFQLLVMQALLKQRMDGQTPLGPGQQETELARQQAQELLDRARQQANEDLMQGITLFINTGIQLGFNTPGHTVQDSLNREIVEDTKKNVPGT